MPHTIKLNTLFREKDGRRETIQAVKGEPYDDRDIQQKLSELEKKLDDLIDAVAQVHNEIDEIMETVY